MTPDWLNETVRAFGRQFGLKGFSLNERGTAGVAFENGVSLRLEYARAALFVSVGVAADSSNGTLKRLLSLAHPGMRSAVRVRAAWFERSGEARLVARVEERAVTETGLGEVFRELWRVMEYFRRAQA